MIPHWLIGSKMTLHRESRRGPRGRRPSTLEALEDRLLLSGTPTTYTVNLISATGTGDGNSGDLPYVITQANKNSNPAGSLIAFDPTLFAKPQLITLTSTLQLSETAGPEVIDGPDGLVVISGSHAVGVFKVDAKVTASFSHLGIVDGMTSGDGGGIDNQGVLTINGSVIAVNTANSSYARGGGIFNDGTLNISNSAIEDNKANQGYGGGIYNDSQLNISNSFIFVNFAIHGGGICNLGTLTGANVTIAYNVVTGSNAGGGLDDPSGTATLNNTIVALNTEGTTTASDIAGPVSSASAFNLIGTGGSGGLTDGDNVNLVDVDPGLGDPSSANAGVPLPGSPAIDNGSNARAVDPATGQPLTTDARGAGFVRIYNGTVDIGAFEVQPPAVVGVSVNWGASGTAPLQTAADGLRLLPAGRNTDLPWLGINQVQITLNQPAMLTAADVTVQGLNRNFGPVTISGSGKNYTITLSRPITAADRVTITISGSEIITFTRRLDILPGDLTDDGVVNGKDTKGVQNQFKHKGGAMPTIFGDILGDGTVDARDNKAEKRQVGKKLPKLGGKVPKAELARALAGGHASANALFDRPDYGLRAAEGATDGNHF